MKGLPHLVLVSLLLCCCGDGGATGKTGPVPATPQDTIQSVIQAVEKDDIATVASSFTLSARQKYQPYFSDLPKMRDFGDSLSNAEPIELTEALAIYKSTFQRNGGRYTYYIYMVKEADGNWKFDVF